MFKNIFCLLSILTVLTTSQGLGPQETCNGKLRCSTCIQTVGCQWCKDETFNGTRCFYEADKTKCTSIENPATKKLSETGASKSITPSNTAVQLRIGQKVNVTMTYTDEKNRPLDLYILMDLSCTMRKHKETVGKLADELAKNLRKLTSHLQIGFGSFVDKPVGPFVSSKAPESAKACEGSSTNYTVPHLFKNHLPMTSDIAEFRSIVNNATILTNVDSPEGGLDALMQAISCTRKIGWRTLESENKARKLIVVSTDGPFHIAGDGKLGGIVRPNDGQCSLDARTHEYDKASIFDYPSISQVRDQMESENIYVIFAVTLNQFPIYKKLVEEIGTHQSAVHAISESATITDAIKKEFEQVVNKVEFRANKMESNNYVDVTFYAKCPESKVYQKQRGCENLAPGAKIIFQVELELKECPLDRNRWNTNVEIAPYQSGGADSLLNITLDLLCGCSCESKQSQNNTGSMKCGDNGYSGCGICNCEPGYTGPTCDCHVKSDQSQIIGQDRCKDDNGRPCGDRGKCVCGECQCDRGYGGKVCECTDKDCIFIPKEDKGTCNSELNQGICGFCKVCKCATGFTGDRCQCPIDTKACMDPKSVGKVCNGFGNCTCGTCKCNEGYNGKFCGNQHAKLKGDILCPEPLVSEVSKCVKCLTMEKLEERKFANCKGSCKTVNANITYMPIIDIAEDTECKGSVRDELECKVDFIIGDRDVVTNEVKIRIQKKVPTMPVENCIEAAPILPVILGVIGAILLIGILLLLIWKVLTYFHDKKEFERFEKEQKDAAWHLNQNPLYKATVTNFQNPAFNTMDD